jgi:hypothetical protein
VIEAQQHDAGYEEEFVGQRVEVGAEFAPLVVAAGDVAIHAVADGRHGEAQQRGEAVGLVAGADVVKHLHHEERDEEHPQDGDFVGGRHRPAG